MTIVPNNNPNLYLVTVRVAHPAFSSVGDYIPVVAWGVDRERVFPISAAGVDERERYRAPDPDGVTSLDIGAVWDKSTDYFWLAPASPSSPLSQIGVGTSFRAHRKAFCSEASKWLDELRQTEASSCGPALTVEELCAHVKSLIPDDEEDGHCVG